MFYSANNVNKPGSRALSYLLITALLNLFLLFPVSDALFASDNTSSKIDLKIKDFIDDHLKGDKDKTHELPDFIKKTIDNVKNILPDSVDKKIDEKTEQFTNDDEVRKFAAKKTATFVISKTTGAICAGLGAAIGLATGNPLGVGMGAYIGWKAGNAVGSVFGDAVAGSVIDEGWSNADPDFVKAIKEQPWSKLTSDSLWSVSGTFAGEATGAILGAKIGATFGTFAFPVFGTVAGAVLGQWVGKKIFTPLFRVTARKLGDTFFNKYTNDDADDVNNSQISTVTPTDVSSDVSSDEDTQKNSVLKSLKDQRDALLTKYEQLLSDGQVQNAMDLFNNEIKDIEEQIQELTK